MKNTDRVSSALKIGTVYRLKNNILVGIDIAKYNNVNKDVRVYTGAEHWFLKDKLGARIGFGSGNNKYGSIALGGSYRLTKSIIQLQIDYAYEYLLNGVMDNTEGNHSIATSLRF